MIKKTLILFALTIMLMGFASAGVGAIWTTSSPCGAVQDENHYDIGDSVYIHGENFDELTDYQWDITGLPGGASCDSGLTVAIGNIMTDENGAFCFEAYVIPEGDCGEYKATVYNKHDNYRVGDLPPAQVPEFGAVVGVLTALGALGVFFLVRKK